MRQHEEIDVPSGEFDAPTIVRDVADVAIDKKASDVTLLDVGKVTTLADYFLIVTGTSERQLKAIADGIQDRLRELGVRRIAREGEPSDGWILLDYGQIIVHVFAPEQRTYYDLERRWSEAPTLLKVQ
jgi:ribosome-associated protein